MWNWRLLALFDILLDFNRFYLLLKALHKIYVIKTMNKAVLEFVHGLVLNQTQIKSRHDFITFVVFYQTESPVMIQPFLEKMTKSELHAVMVGGFATIAGSVYGAYVKFGVSSNCNFSGLSDKLCRKEPRSCDFGRDPSHHHHHHHHSSHLFTH